MATITPVRIESQLDDKNRARLEAKSYTKAYTDVPNRVLPESYKQGLGVIYTALSGLPFEDEENTFTVRADNNGVFKRLYSPTIFSTEEGGLVIRWGEQDIPLVLAKGKISTASSPKTAKFVFKEENIGKYKEPVLTVSIPDGSNLFVFSMPIRSADYENKVSSDILEILLEENPTEIAALVQLASDKSKRGESTGERLVGEFVKVAQLPLGEYTITGYKTKLGGEYGPAYFMQALVPEPFEAQVSRKEGDEWVEETVEISDYCIIKPNGALKKVLAAEPVITSEFPATLKVIEHGVYNGFDTAKCTLKCQAFAENVESFALDF